MILLSRFCLIGLRDVIHYTKRASGTIHLNPKSFAYFTDSLYLIFYKYVVFYKFKTLFEYSLKHPSHNFVNVNECNLNAVVFTTFLINRVKSEFDIDLDKT